MKKSLLFIGVIILFLFSCKKNDSGTSINPTPVPEGLPLPAATMVRGVVVGIVFNENNQPVSGANVIVNGTAVQTGADGKFNSGRINLDKYLTSVKVNVSGYYSAYRTISATDAINYVIIKLIRKQVVASFSSATQGEVNLSNGSTISFAANTIVDKVTGAAYSGNVKVYTTYIDPTSPDIKDVLPGSLLGTSSGRLFALKSAGMIAVELESDAGIPLQLKSGSSAAMKLAIPVSLQNAAPSQIDTWSLDENGVWKREGTASRIGNFYSFTASHFSFWNCDVPTNAVYLNIRAVNSSNVPYNSGTVSLSSSTTFGTTYGWVNSMGVVSGFVPAGEVLMSTYYPTQLGTTCSGATVNIGPFTASQDVTVTYNVPVSQIYTITGSVVDCNGNPLANGNVMVSYGAWNAVFAPVVNGAFTAQIVACSAPATVVVIAADSAAGVQGMGTTITLSGNTSNAGTLTACGVSTNQFIYYTTDGNQTFTTINSVNSSAFFNLSSSNSNTFLYAVDQLQGKSIAFLTNANGLGNFSGYDSLQINYTPYTVRPGGGVTITRWGNVGDMIEGNFTINYYLSSTSNPRTVAGGFRIKRMN